MQENQIKLLNVLLHRINKALDNSELEKQFKKLQGLTTIEIGIINLVSENPDIILKEISDILETPKSTLTSAIDRLEKRNYLTRFISKRDRRSFGLKLTEEGKLAQKEHLELEHVVCSRLLNALDDDNEKEELLSLLNKIASKIEE
ncbi:MarR family winged helix-turn-helix transcriptional regulator [Abyssisolibacter fermentans]|uniref:MarR family winged helix-turn-helix transcriptional regulator n=1 Tax=Abyssisolibacter fermentans TaxID=1766203 RepID=UPI000836165F|nr:MarR family transcriptional regulator [Abyssisolibacter fermentans]